MASDDVRKLLISAKRLLNRGRPREVQSILELAVSLAPGSTKLLREISKLYLQAGMSEKAISCLELISETSMPTFVSADDAMTHADFEYLELLAQDTAEDEYQPEIAEPSRKPPLRARLSLNRRKCTPDVVTKVNSEYLDKSGHVLIMIRGHTGCLDYNQLSEKPKEPTSSLYSSLECGHQKEQLSNHAPEEWITNPLLASNVSASQSAAIPSNDTLTSSPERPPRQEIPDASITEYTLTFDDESCWTYDFTELEKYSLDEFFSIEEKENFESDTVTSDYYIGQEDVDPFDPTRVDLWDELEEANQEAREAEKLCHEGADFKTRLERAEQIAVAVIFQFQLSGGSLDFLRQVFFENGWSATRSALEREISLGTTIDEIKIAHELRHIWKACDRYWITFSKLTPFSQVTEPVYRHMSWQQALKIIRVFNCIPCIEEIEVFLDDEFEYWYQHSILRRTHPAFIKYLCHYRASGKYPNLSVFESCKFDIPEEYDGLNSVHFNNPLSDSMQKLNACGIDIFSRFTPQRAFPAAVSDEYFSAWGYQNEFIEDNE
ncbi:tetratricopeptide repeat protein [Dickeya fangzhongdai]|uniref:tetratricopeptide repeat protein n=1 Tax=Dickeya fangzhongdai TaxID=1778540 RepID=UPI000537D57A|nr:tetratricopeptide repeat protein [Dickeya fangzhongdai]KGU00029.1 hypothetical protein NM75_01370 [Dickeya fangzhongdai]